jgi:drug/metabolite transporter (DMT)-like permease
VRDTFASRGPIALTESTPRWQVILGFATVYLLWGSTYLGIRFAIESIPPFLMGGSRFLISGFLLYVWARLRGAPKPTLQHWKVAAVIGFLLPFIGNGAVVWSEQHVPSGMVSLLVATTPVWMVLVDWASPNGRRPAGPVIFGVITGLIGLVLLIGPSEILGGGRVDLLSATALMIGSICWAAGSVYSTHANQPSSPILAIGMQMIAGGAMLTLLSIAVGEPQHFDISRVTGKSLFWFVYLFVFGSMIGYTTYIWLLSKASAAKVSTYAYVNPLVAIVLGNLAAGEPITRRMLIAAATILSAVAVLTLVRSSPRHA